MPRNNNNKGKPKDDGAFHDDSSSSESESDSDDRTPPAKRVKGRKKLSNHETIAVNIPVPFQFIRHSNESGCNVFCVCPNPNCKLSSTQDGEKGLYMKQSQAVAQFLIQYAKHITACMGGEDNLHEEIERIGEEELAVRTASVKKELKLFFDGHIDRLNINDKLLSGERITPSHIVAAYRPSGIPCMETNFGTGKQQYFFECPNEKCKSKKMYNGQKGIYTMNVCMTRFADHLLCCLTRDTVLERLLTTSVESLDRSVQLMSAAKTERLRECQERVKCYSCPQVCSCPQDYSQKRSVICRTFPIVTCIIPRQFANGRVFGPCCC